MNDDTSSNGFRSASSANGSGDPQPFADDADSAMLADLLIDSFPPVDPDPGVWDRIEAQIAANDASVASIESAPSWRSRRLAPLMAIAAVFVLVAASAFAIAQQSDGGVVVAGGDDIVRELSDPVSGATTLRVVSAADGTSMAINDGLPELAADQTYQLWSVVGDEIVSVGLLGSAPAEVPLRLEGTPAVLALTVEVAGGVAVSSADPVAVWANS